jgi:hypothetical protein
MSIISDIVKGGASGIFAGASEVLKDIIPDPTARAAAQEKLQELALTNSAHTADLAEQQLEAQLKDVQSARDMEVAALKQNSWFAKNVIHLLAAAVTVGFFGLLGYMCKYDVPAANKDMLNIMLGSLGTAWISIVGFYYGSSKSDSDKNETIKNLSSN